MPPELLGAGVLRERFAKYGFFPSKALGQNFVVDPNTIRKVIRLAEVAPDQGVLEIGAGAGSLTVGLAAAAARVIAVEFDRRLEPILGEAVGQAANVDVVMGDIMAADVATFDADAVVANLPYNIAVPVLLKTLKGAPRIGRCTVMTQREVGERLVAGPGSRAYGHVSVMLRYFGRAKVVGTVSRRAFYPVPNVDSVIVRIDRTEPPEVDRDRLFDVVRAAFAQRRKMLRNTVATVAGGPEEAEAVLTRAGLEPRARAQDVDLAGFVRLAKELA